MTNWNFSPEIQIVYSVYGSISYNGKTYPKAYIVKKDDKKSLDNAIAWATESCYYKTTVVPKIVETTNEGFSMQIVTAPGNSSQSGKLAFWMCCFEKPGIEPFSTGINSELLSLVILQSVLDHGRLNETVCFARNSGQLGVLHTNMPEYTQMQNDMNTKAQMKAKKKTKNWRTGYTYSTATQSDIMMGYFPKYITYDEDFHWLINFSPDNTPIYCYTWCNDIEEGCKDKLDTYLYNGWLHVESNTTCPSRAEDKKEFDENDFNTSIVERTKRVSLALAEYSYHEQRSINCAMSLLPNHPDETKDLLKKIKDIFAKKNPKYLNYKYCIHVEKDSIAFDANLVGIDKVIDTIIKYI